MQPKNEKELLDYLTTCDILDMNDIRNICDMIKHKTYVQRIHRYKIFQGKDGRWYTYISDDSNKYGRHKIVKRTESLMYDYLYEYYSQDNLDSECTLEKIYPEWLKFKLLTANRNNTVHRIDTDYHKYYINEPLSEKILSTPLLKLTVADIKVWSHALIKKYNLTQKAYFNITTILRQVFQYLIDKEVTDRNPCKLIKIPSTSFRRTPKKKAETQVFFPDEVALIIDCCKELAEQTQDENYLAIPIFFYTGIRIGECLGLSYEDFDKENNSLYLHCSLIVDDEMNEDGTWGKRKFVRMEYLKCNEDPRDILVCDKCFDIVEKIREIQIKKGISSTFLFNDITPSNVALKLYRICEQLNISRRSPHKGRKTYISILLNKGVDPDFVREQVGHRELSTTYNSYTYSTTRRAERIEQLNKILVS